jgi:hypothetical protein
VAVEAFLDARATRLGPRVPRAAERPVVRDALWLCPCYSDEDPPVWLIGSTQDGAVVWTRVPHRVGELELVDAGRFCGAHVHPATVLDWLHGGRDDPGFDDDDAERVAIADGLRALLGGAHR